MERRKFLERAGIGFAATAATSAALAQGTPAPAGLPEIKWRLASSFPKSLDTLYGAGDLMAKRVGELTGGKFQIRVFAAGEIVPGLQVMDAVQNGTVECGHTASSYYTGKEITLSVPTGLPFGLNSRQHNAWWIHGGGSDLSNEFYREYGIHCLLLGNTGAQAAGWFRKEIKTTADLKGVKMRVAGIAGQIMSRLGVIPQQIAGGEIYQALERGTLDAVEFVGPYDDEKLGFNKVAPYYYFPGWHEGNAALQLFVNLKQWESLPKEYKAALEIACSEATTWVTAKYDTQNAPALRRLLAAGTQLRGVPRPVLEALYKTAMAEYDDISAKNAKFAKLSASVMKFRREQTPWFQVAEDSYDNFLAYIEGNAKRSAAAKK